MTVRHALLHWDGDTLLLFGQPQSLSSGQRDVLRRCARPIQVATLPGDELSALVDLGLITVQVPLDPEEPATSIRRLLNTNVTGDAHDQWVGVVAEAERRLEPLEKCDRRAEEVATLLAEARDWLTQVTGAPALRNAGRTYGARTPIFCVARRDVEFALDSEILAGAPALEGVLDSGARICQAAAQAMTDAFGLVLDGRLSAPLAQVWPDLIGPSVSAACSATAIAATTERGYWYDAVGAGDGAGHQVVAT